MIRYVTPIAIYNYAALRLFEKLYQIQARECHNLFTDSSCIYFDRPFFMLL